MSTTPPPAPPPSHGGLDHVRILDGAKKVANFLLEENYSLLEQVAICQLTSQACGLAQAIEGVAEVMKQRMGGGSAKG